MHPVGSDAQDSWKIKILSCLVLVFQDKIKTRIGFSKTPRPRLKTRVFVNLAKIFVEKSCNLGLGDNFLLFEIELKAIIFLQIKIELIFGALHTLKNIGGRNS